MSKPAPRNTPQTRSHFCHVSSSISLCSQFVIYCGVLRVWPIGRKTVVVGGDVARCCDIVDAINSDRRWNRRLLSISLSLSFFRCISCVATGGKAKADSTPRSCQTVRHPITNRDLCCLTSEVNRGPARRSYVMTYTSILLWENGHTGD